MRSFVVNTSWIFCLLLVLEVTCVSHHTFTSDEERPHDNTGNNHPIQQNVVECESCKGLVDLLKGFAKSNSSFDDYKWVAVELCTLFHIEDHSVCSGITDVYGYEFERIFSSPGISAKPVCEHWLLCDPDEGKDKGGTNSEHHAQDSTPIRTSRMDSSPALLQPRSLSGNFLHISDLHLDMYYEANTNPNCGEPLCCRMGQGPGDAGVYGNYECDLPLITLESAFQSIATRYTDLDFVIWTGDNPPHDVWNDTVTEQQEATDVTAAIVTKYLPGVPVFPALGNHEFFPTDQFGMTDKRSLAVLENAAECWAAWLDESALATVRSKGYYTAPVVPGLRVISLNTQYFDILNFWNALYLNTSDPGGQLQFLEEALLNASQSNERVYIIGHIPPNDSFALYPYIDAYLAIVERYNSTIVAHFFGHTHNDQFNVLTDQGTQSVPWNTVYTAPSLTTYTQQNPSYRVLEYDTSNGAINDYHQYVCNITEANLVNNATWNLEYTASEEYNMTAPLTPLQWSGLVDKMESDEDVFALVYYNFHCGAVPYDDYKSCDAKCQRSRTCLYRSNTHRDRTACSKK
eukprot:TRINITY_DN15366_c0_g1_i1.p1 TRINITY_DN15366_c0_g1~~TRINITY_DN15366_c0_g1_i1.p1  ORF type:complete len:574 (-),score=87.52 TRINITY_DN15366_c0_g1_i1:107-1828(-)